MGQNWLKIAKKRKQVIFFLTTREKRLSKSKKNCSSILLSQVLKQKICFDPKWVQGQFKFSYGSLL